MPQVATVVGSFSGSERQLFVERIVVWSELGILRTSGRVLTNEGLLELEVHLKIWRMRAHLQSFGHHPTIDGFDLDGRLSGQALNPVFDGELRLHDVRYQLLRIALLRSPAVFSDGTLVADPLQSPLYGRYLTATLRLSLFEASLRQLQRPTLEFTWGFRRR